MKLVLVVSRETQHDFATSNMGVGRQSFKSDSTAVTQSKSVK